MADKFDEQAAALVDHCRYCGIPDYRPKCKADYEDSITAIAAALRELGAENERLKNCNNPLDPCRECIHCLKTDWVWKHRDDLRQQLAAVQEGVSSFLRHCPGLDEIACVRAVTEFHKWLAAQGGK